MPEVDESSRQHTDALIFWFHLDSHALKCLRLYFTYKSLRRATFIGNYSLLEILTTTVFMKIHHSPTRASYTSIWAENDTMDQRHKNNSSRTGPRDTSLPRRATLSVLALTTHSMEGLTRTIGLPPAGNNVPSADTITYQGYKFFKADPIPGEEAVWTKVERMEMEVSQSELYRKVQKRANKVSAAQQYQMLSEVLQAHVDRLIHEQRKIHPHRDWSCVYAKERSKASKVRNASREDYEVVSMQVILMQRPLQTKSNPRTPMGELVDLGPQFGAGFSHPRRVNSENIHQASDHLPHFHAGLKLPPSSRYRWVRNIQNKPSGTAVELEGIAPDFAARPSTADGVLRNRNPDGSGKFGAVEELRGVKRSRYVLNEPSYPSEPAYGTTPHSSLLHFPSKRPEHSHSESDEESETIEYNAQSDDGSFTPRMGSPSERSTGRVSPSIRCTCQDHCCSSASIASLEDPDDRNLYSSARLQRQDDATFSDMESKASRCESPCSSVDTVQPRSVPPAKRPRLSALHKLPLGQLEKKPYIQFMNEDQLRTRLLECEARLEQWEKTFYRQTQWQMRVVQRQHHGY